MCKVFRYIFMLEGNEVMQYKTTHGLNVGDVVNTDMDRYYIGSITRKLFNISKNKDTGINEHGDTMNGNIRYITFIVEVKMLGFYHE